MNELTPTLLLEVSKFHREELNRHEKLAADVYQWTCTLLLGIAAAELAWASTDASKSFQPIWPLPAILCSTVILLSILASSEIIRRKKAYDSNARIVARAARALGLFSPHCTPGAVDPLYMAHWQNWGDRNNPATKSSPTFMVFNLCFLALAVCTLSIYLAWLKYH